MFGGGGSGVEESATGRLNGCQPLNPFQEIPPPSFLLASHDWEKGGTELASLVWGFWLRWGFSSGVSRNLDQIFSIRVHPYFPGLTVHQGEL